MSNKTFLEISNFRDGNLWRFMRAQLFTIRHFAFWRYDNSESLELGATRTTTTTIAGTVTPYSHIVTTLHSG